MRIDTVENRTQIVERVVIPNHDQDIARADGQSLRCQIIAGFEIELIELSMLRAPFAGALFRK